MRTILILEVFMAQKGYNTAAREAVIGFFRSNPDRQFAAEEVFDALSSAAEDKKPGKSTVYRLVSRLCEEGKLRRYRDGHGSNSLFQYVRSEGGCEKHFHLKCTDCGRVYHLECEKSEELLCHVLSEHGFKINSGLSMLYGRCEKCGEKG